MTHCYKFTNLQGNMHEENCNFFDHAGFKMTLFSLWERYRSISPPKLFELNFFTMVWHLFSIGLLIFKHIQFHEMFMKHLFCFEWKLKNVLEKQVHKNCNHPSERISTHCVLAYSKSHAIHFIVVTCHIGWTFHAQWKILLKKGIKMVRLNID